MGPILDSQGRPVRVVSRAVRENFESRNTPLSAGQAPGMTMLSRFAGNKQDDIHKYRKLAADIQAANPSIRSPLLNQSNFYMPESDSSTGEPNRLLNQWLTYYVRWHGLVGNAMSLHSTVADTKLLTNSEVKDIKDVTSADKVLSSSGLWQNVLWNESHNFDGDLYSIRGTGTLAEEYTYNHPVKIVPGGKVVKVASDGQTYSAPDITGLPMWVPAERVTKGDYLVIPRFSLTKEYSTVDLAPYIPSYTNSQNQPIYDIITQDGVEYIRNLTGLPKKLIPRHIKVTKELAELLGWYVAKGSGANGCAISFSLNKDKDPCDRIVALIESIFNITPAKRFRDMVCAVNFGSHLIYNFLTDVCGKGALNKKVPDFIAFNTPEILKEFVKAYIAGDGCVEGQNRGNGGSVTCITISKTLAYQLRTYCTKLGFLFSMRSYDVKRKTSVLAKNGKLKKDSLQWILTCAHQEIMPLLYGISKPVRKPITVKKDEYNFYIPITKIEKRHYMGPVYDIKTEDHSFITTFTVHNSELPLSRFALRGVEDPKIAQYYEDMTESMDLHLKCVELLRQFFTYGEVIPFAFWSDNYNCFTDLTFLDSNFVYVKGHYLLHSDEGDSTEFYELEPDPLLVNIVKSDDYVTKRLRTYLDDDFVAAVRQNKRLLLSNFSTHMIRNKIKWGDLRGTSIILRCLKSLLYSDKLRESNYIVADGHINPKWIWKLGQAGDLSNGGYMPTEEDLAAFRDLLVSSNNDPLFTIITHYAVQVEAVGLNGKLLPINQEFQQIENEILTALFLNKALTTGDGPNYASASVAFRALMSRYIPIRAQLERYIYQKLFAPVAYANKFFQRKQCDLAHSVRTGNDETNKLVIPTIDWRSKSNLLDDGSIKSIISSMVATGRLPMKILTEALDLDYEEVRSYLYSEQASVFDAVAIEGRKKLASANTDETMIGQPFIPKQNQPVSTKARRGEGASPQAKKAAGKVNRFSKLLSLKPLTAGPLDVPKVPSLALPVAKKDPIQSQVDKGKPERGGNPDPVDPMAKALELGASKAREFDVMGDTQNKRMTASKLVARNYKERKIAQKNALVNRPVEAPKQPHERTIIEVAAEVVRA